MFNNEQLQTVFERDITPLFEERRQYLQESVIDRIEVRDRWIVKLYHF